MSIFEKKNLIAALVLCSQSLYDLHAMELHAQSATENETDLFGALVQEMVVEAQERRGPLKLHLPSYESDQELLEEQVQESASALRSSATKLTDTKVSDANTIGSNSNNTHMSGPEVLLADDLEEISLFSAGSTTDGEYYETYSDVDVVFTRDPAHSAQSDADAVRGKSKRSESELRAAVLKKKGKKSDQGSFLNLAVSLGLAGLGLAGGVAAYKLTGKTEKSDVDEDAVASRQIELTVENEPKAAESIKQATSEVATTNNGGGVPRELNDDLPNSSLPEESRLIESLRKEVAALQKQVWQKDIQLVQQAENIEILLHGQAQMLLEMQKLKADTSDSSHENDK